MLDRGRVCGLLSFNPNTGLSRAGIVMYTSKFFVGPTLLLVGVFITLVKYWL